MIKFSIWAPCKAQFCHQICCTITSTITIIVIILVVAVLIVAIGEKHIKFVLEISTGTCFAFN